MQSLILKNDTLKKEIQELEAKISLIESTDKLERVSPSKKKSRFGTLKKSAINIFDDSKDKRSAKTIEAVNQLHELLLNNKYDIAEKYMQEKQKVLFGKVKKGGPTIRPLDLADEYGETALQKAVKKGNIATVEELIELGASVDIPDAEGETALMSAAKYGMFDMVKLLIEKANRDAKTKYTQKTALHFASQYGHVAIVELLLSNGCNADFEDIDGHTALQVAKDKETFKAIKKVLKTHKRNSSNHAGTATPTESDDEDNEELAFVTGKEEYDPFKILKKERSYSQDEEMKPLIEENKELESKRQNLLIRVEDLKSKRRPRDNFDVLKALDSAARRKFLGFDSTPKDDLIGKYLTLVLQGDQPGALEDVEKILTEKRKKFMVDKDAVDEFGETALMKAARLGYVAMLNMLLLYKCDVDRKDHDGYTAVMKAAQFGKVQCVERLIEEGAELDMTTKVGKLTALMLAAQRGHGNVCKLLIQEGANHQSLDSSGKKVIELAANEETKNIIHDAIMEHPIMHNNVQI